MINKIVTGIAEKLSACFKDIRIYTEEVEQGFKTPCFSIILRELGAEIYRGRRRRLKAEAEIHNSMTAELMTALEYINIDGFPVRPIGLKAKTGDDSMYITLSFDLFYTTEDDENPEMMGEYSEKTRIINS